MKYGSYCVHFLLASVISFLFMSCASTGPNFQRVIIEHDSNPVIYVYRPNTICFIGAREQFLVDDTLITLKNNEYAWVSVSPGTHKIISGEFKSPNVPPLTTEINTVSGKSYYVKYDISCDSNFLLDRPTFKFHLYEVNEPIALDELTKSHLTMLPIQKR